ncbi:hypothetical protein Q4Y15_000803 [Campylobacter fetus]|uniref:Uncharacterized protein n=2 Tax=Campylobacter fetus TaxID=196 RepID=A0A5L4XJ91_CAMFE|nr:hypothetical protein [Campylobacter fetus]EAI3886499.1 hypothetical protein [Campylobacter fetus]EAI3915579.1 hypothetical protein [Campylobacter fetus]EAI3919214.1 hypothetical protein [Campylobacter fetus]EAI8858496.1 hypothetical protein [Campylobacter fetus]EAJ0320998.1 hypothetical protein [Campylobacter fetus]
MKNLFFLLIGGILVGTLAAFLYYMGKDYSVPKSQVKEAYIACDLNIEECDVDTKLGNVTFSFYPRPLVGMAPTTLKISGLPQNIKDPNVRIYGLNMEMGVISAPLTKQGSSYTANIVISLCVISRMEYRLEVLSGDKPLGVSIDFYIKS